MKLNIEIIDYIWVPLFPSVDSALPKWFEKCKELLILKLILDDFFRFEKNVRYLDASSELEPVWGFLMVGMSSTD